MFGIDSSELMFIALVALLVIGPKDLPRAMRWVGQWVGKGRAMSRHLRSGFDAMMREAEMEELQKTWAAQNEAIMQATSLPSGGLPDLAGPTLLDTSYQPWPAPPEALPAPTTPAAETLPAVETAPAKPKRARKPRQPKVIADSGETA